MPLPTSKRFKKRQPKLPLPPSAPPDDPPAPSDKQHSSFLARKLLVRVVCADPDATDDSSDEDEGARKGLQRIGRKRAVREIWLSSAPPLNLHSRGVDHQVEIRGNHTAPASRGANQWRHNRLSSSHQVRPSKLPKEMSCSKEDEEEAQEQLRWFLSGFGGDDDMWDFDLGDTWRAHEDKNSSGMLDLELDAEVLSWIDSLQGLP